MSIVIGILKSADPAEKRVALVPDVAKKFRQVGAEILIQRGACAGANFVEADFADVKWADTADEVLAAADCIFSVEALEPATLAKLKAGAVVLGSLHPYGSADRIKALQEKKITAFATELIPRISRAQSMDTLSSQAACSGYQCVLIAASHCPKFFPMLTYAAGTIRPARVMVIGAGVAGLQAIATAKRLGAMVEAYDVRPETREQIESLGAKFVDTGVSAAGTGGYARELTDEEKAQQAGKLAKAISLVDVLITTAAVPGKPAPKIVSAEMVAGMRQGAVVVDMAAETGGNVVGTVAGQTVQVGPASIIGPTHLPSRMAVHSSEMFAKNLFNFIGHMIKEGQFQFDWEDEVLAGACLTHEGEVRHAMVKKVLSL